MPQKKPSPAAELTVAILAAGRSPRMKSFGNKSLLDLGGETLLERLVWQFRRRWPFARIVVVSGHQHQRLRRKASGADFLENPDHETCGVAHSLRMALESSVGPVLAVYGDLVFFRDAIQGLPTPDCSVLYGEAGFLRRQEVGLSVDEGGLVGRLSYSLPVRWCQTVLVQPREKEILLRAMRDSEGSRNFLGHEVLNLAIGRGGLFRYMAIPGFMMEVDCSKDLAAVRKAVELEAAECV